MAISFSHDGGDLLFINVTGSLPPDVCKDNEGNTYWRLAVNHRGIPSLIRRLEEAATELDIERSKLVCSECGRM